eukprot:CAMPEP_0198294804 /NCGR_PEP_ID=MMETSP1449-20131203/24470_1 /TAXON_ID=420275 /ORGANISM="Attheya septentrionalis, Strain CCMP2084" /LENGTH=437 /DNA_ID=CAMNT_0043994885 /DNA_START=6 /DNA_END=1319 /DNA_ORIENTATION=-
MAFYDEEGREISQYEKMRLERIARNEAYLEKLGLGSAKKKLLEATARTKKKRAAAVARCLPKRKAGEERRSARLSSSSRKKQNHSSPLVMLSYDDEEEEHVEQDDDPADTPRIPSRRRSTNIHREQWSLSEEEKSVFKGNMDENYLGKFKEFLVYHNKISEQNVRNVMRQVSKLALGEGIRYESPRYGWKEGYYFCKGQKVTPLSDLVSLKEEGQECEDKWGRDHGNGWLIQHPLQKLLLFQQFCLNNPDFLTARCKLRDYYALDEEDEEEPLSNNANTNNTPIVSSSLPALHVVTTSEDNSGESDDTLALVVTPQKEASTDSNNNNRENQAIFENQRIAKEFDGVTYCGTHCGTVTTYSTERELWWVSYDDGDSEELDEEELQTCILHYQQTNNVNTVAATTTTPQKKRSKSSMVTPSPSTTQKSKRRKLYIKKVL